MPKEEALKLALEALEDKHYQEAHYLIVQALTQPAQKPVAWYDKHGMITHDPFEGVTPLYTTPPKRPWVGLTREESLSILDDCRTPITYVSMIEAKLKEKNS